MRQKSAFLLLLSLLLASLACHKKSVPPIELEQCDPAGFIGCISQNSSLFIPIVDTNLSLTYSSRWSVKRKEKWDVAPLGLGGWSINVVQRYDRPNRLLINGDGTWRLTDAVNLPSGEQVVPSYDGSLAYIFDSAGRHVRTVDGHLGTELLKLSYDPDGRLANIDGYLNGLPVHLAVRRDPRGNPRVLLGMDGASTALEVDSHGRLTGMLDPAGAETRISWNAAGLVESKTDPGGGVRQFSYDSKGNLASDTDADGVPQHYERKLSGNSLEIRVSTAKGRQWAYRTEAVKSGIRRTLIRPDGTESTETIDAQGNRTLKLADGTTWSMGAVANPIWGAASPILTPLIQNRPDGVTSRQELKYNFHSQPVLPYVLSGSLTTTINGQSWTQNFDPVKRRVDVVDPTGRRKVATYDEKGRLLSYSAPGTAPASYRYNSQGRLVSKTIGAGNLAHTVHYGYDAAAGKITASRADGVIQKATLDGVGRIVSASEGDGSTALFAYDATGRLTQIQPPGGLRFTLGASPAGRNTAFVPPIVKDDASIEISSFDQDGLLTTTSGLGKHSISYDYDSAGRVISSSFDQGKRTFSYDSHSGLLRSASDPSGVNTSYGYTGGTVNTVAWSGAVAGSLSTQLDVNGRPIHESVNGGHDLAFAYDVAGNLTGVGPLSLKRDAATGLVTQSSLGAVRSESQFDDNGLLIRNTTVAGNKLVLDQQYTRDALGRVKGISETGTDGETITTEYSYDRADRLASVRINRRAVETDTYDPAGNRVSIVHAGETKKANYDERERLLSFGTTQYTWMPDGTLAGVAQGQRAAAFVYDDFGALRQASLPTGKEIKYLIDADGRRVGRVVAGKLVSAYLYNFDGSIAAETDDSGKIISRFGYDDLGHIALLERNGINYRVITDQVGSPRVVIDSRSGEIVEQISYDAWGDITEDKAPGFLCVGFAGGLRDPDTGLTRFGARDYDPVEGRWTAADPTRFAGGDTNLYRYADGDPVNLSDPRGTLPDINTLPGVNWFYKTPLYKYVLKNQDNNNNSSQNTGSPSNGNPGPSNDPEGWCASPLCFNVPPTQVVPLNGNPANPPPNGNPTGNNPPPNWSCNSPGTCNNGSGLVCGNGTCFSLNGTYFCNADFCFFPDGSSCSYGYCGFNTDGDFYCKAAICEGPSGQECVGQDNGTCELGPPDLHGTNPTQPNPQGPGQPNPNKPGQPNPNNPNQPNPNNPGHPNPGNPGQPGPNGPGQPGPGQPGPNGPGQPGPNNPNRPGPGGGNGEPHLYSMSGSYFDFQLVGEFLLATSPDRNFVIQARQEPWRPVSAVSVTSAIAANVDGDHVGIYTKEPSFLVINGTPIQKQEVDQRLPHGGRVQRHGATVEVRWKDGNHLRIEYFAGLLNYDFVVNGDAVSGADGLLGVAHGNPGKLAGRDGTLLDHTVLDFVSTLYKQVGNSWRIKPSESLFHYWPGESTAKFTDLRFPPKIVSSASLDPQTRANAESICRAVGVRTGPALDDCVLDVGVTGMPALAAASVGLAARPASAVGAPHATNATAPSSPVTPDQYSISIGDTVSPDHPAPGAGFIGKVGEKQTYSFTAKPGEIVFVKADPCQGAPVAFDVQDAANHSIGAGGCGGFGPITFPSEGTYRLIANADRASNIRYTFSLFPTTLDQFSIKIGDTVSPDHPAPGAGTIKNLGQKQSYSFEGRAGQAVYFALGPCKGADPTFDVFKPDGGLFANRGANCHLDIGRQLLPVGGKYHIVASTDKSNVFSQYSFSITTVPPDEHFSVHLPVTVSPDSPARGAGRIRSQGVEQFYDFSAQPGTSVHIVGKCDRPCPNLAIKVDQIGDSGSAPYQDLNLINVMKFDWKLPPGGKYTIQVRSNGYVGEYGFTASSEH